MFKRKEKELKEKIKELEREVAYWRASGKRTYDKFYQELLNNATLLSTIEKQKKGT